MAIDPRITPKQQAEERALRFALLADTAVLTLMVPVGILGGSLTLKAEAIRFVLMLLIEYFAYAVINLLAWDGMRRAARGGTTVVMQGQLKSRGVKLVSSLVVVVTMTVAALSTDGVVVAWADAGGSMFVAIFIFLNAIAMLRAGIPDLLDRSAGEAVRDTVDRVLAGKVGDYERLDRVRSRRSGRVVFIEVVLSFEAGLTIAEVNRRIEALKQSMEREIEHADISILTTLGASGA